jgi:hypothetical protein
MQLQGIKIEYLIIGGTSIIWVIPFTYLFLGSNSDVLSKISLGGAITIVPLIYVLGMIIDGLAAKLLRNIKKQIKNAIILDKEHSSHRLYIYNIIPENIEFYKVIEVKQSRYRIMRGMFFNTLMCTLIFIFSVALYEQPFDLIGTLFQKILLVALPALLTIFCFSLWKSYVKRFFEDLNTISKLSHQKSTNS